MSRSLPIVAIITHHANEMAWTCVDSILKQQAFCREIWIVHSNDDRCQNLPAWENTIPIHYHWLEDNCGFAAAVNWILSQASGTIFILNDDTRLEPNCLVQLLEKAEQYPKAILQPEIWLQTDQDHTPLIENSGHYVGIDGSNFACDRYQRPSKKGLSSRLCFSGAAFWLPEHVYQQPMLQTMDVSLSPFGEDLDYALRAIRCGVDIFCVHSAVIIHRWGGSYERYSAQKVSWVESHRIQSKFHNLPIWMILLAPLASLHRYRHSLQDSRIPQSNTTEAVWATCKGIYQGYRAFPKAMAKRQAAQFSINDWEFTKRWWRQS